VRLCRFGSGILLESGANTAAEFIDEQNVKKLWSESLK